MLFRQLVHEDLGCASYLVGDEAAGVAAVVDPKLEIEEYLALAERHGVRIAHVLETHNHADHVSGRARLRAATGAQAHVHRLAGAAYPHEPFDDGWELALGSVRVRALHTPGHRPEHTAFAVADLARSERPWALLSGDTLLVGDVARPDLAIDAEEGARGLFASLHERLLALPDDCELWPGHLGGSLCASSAIDAKGSSTIGFERRANPLLSADLLRFVELAVAGLPPRPPSVGAIVARNVGPEPGEPGPVPRLSPAELEAAAAAGAVVVDLRPVEAFRAGHVRGAVCVPAGGSGVGTKLGWIAGGERPLLLVADDERVAARAAWLARAVAAEPAGLLAGGFAAWVAERRPLATLPALDDEQLAARLTTDPDLQLLDVRTPAEWAAGHVVGARPLPYQELVEGPPADLDRDRPVAVMCASGARAATAASLLARAGVQDVLHVTGGVNAWRARGRPLVAGAPVGAAR